MLILIPPSEGKSSKNSSNTKFKDTNFIFENEVKAIQKQLSNCNDAELQKIYGVTLQKAKQLMYMQNQRLWLNKLLGISWSMIPLEWSSLQFCPQWFLAQF